MSQEAQALAIYGVGLEIANLSQLLYTRGTLLGCTGCTSNSSQWQAEERQPSSQYSANSEAESSSYEQQGSFR